MKKRSLFAAVAMLIVSAIVLTSATYAWFNVGGGAEIIAVKGTVMEAGSGVRIKTDKTGLDWTNKLFPQDFVYSGSASTLAQQWTATWDTDAEAYVYTRAQNDTGAYAPMSTVDGETFFMYQTNGSNEFTLSDDNANSINFRDTYVFHIATVAETANVTGTFTLKGPTSGATAAAAGRAMVFISTNNGTSWTAYTGSGSTPIVYSAGSETGATNAMAAATTTTVSDSNNNFIMDSADEGYSANAAANVYASVTPVAANGGVTITIPNVPTRDSSRVMIKTVVWIEGQDGQCTPTLANGQLFSSWSFQVATN